MKRFFKRINPLPLLIAVLLLAAAALLACGPASQAEPQTEPVSQAIAKDGEPEPTLEPTPEPPEYPNLDATLQEIVARFEAEELSESAAATQAHTYHGSSVLVTVDLSANIDAVDAWMESKDISSRQANPSHPTPNIYGFVKVSLLGALSQQDGVSPKSRKPSLLGRIYHQARTRAALQGPGELPEARALKAPPAMPRDRDCPSG